MSQFIQRAFALNLPKNKSCFIWGPRQVGKSSWIKSVLKPKHLINLLDTVVYADYAQNPGFLFDRMMQFKHKGLLQGPVVIDEVQKIPALLEEVHHCIEDLGVSFVLTGSSARQLRRGGANLLGGRAYRRVFHPLTLFEVGEFESPAIQKILVSGLLPSHYLATDPKEGLRAYVSDYLKEEIAAEALRLNLPAFSGFLRAIAISNGELINYVNLASETGVSAKVIKSYTQILEDTFLGFRLEPWRKSKNRRMILTDKFYLFDVGVTQFLTQRSVGAKTPEFGKAFEHLVLLELKAHQSYRNPDRDIYYWRTSTQAEIDFILGDREVAIEVKATARVCPEELKAFAIAEEDGKFRRKIVVCLERESRRMGDIEILSIKDFVTELWGGEI